MIRAQLHRLARDEQGASMMEFGLILTPFCVLVLGAFDVGHTLYMQAVLQGVVQKAAREGTLENSAGNATDRQTAIDSLVRSQVRDLNKTADVSFSRRFYRSFSDAALKKSEDFNDTNGNGLCDGPIGGNPGESYVDANNNNVWDRDGGDAGQGNARDNVIYTVTVAYPRLFPIDRFIGGSGTTRIVATTVLANQPYGSQGSYGSPTVRQCT